MSTYILYLLQGVWDWILAPPLHWAVSLSLEWKLELGVVLFVGAFWAFVIEYWFIGREQFSAWWAERLRIREWYYYARKREREVRAILASLRRRADKQEELAERLQTRSDGCFTGPLMWRASARRRRRAQALRDQADRLERLWSAIEQERGGPGGKAGMQARILRLMSRLGSGDDSAAANALAELNRVSGWFDWETLAPTEMTDAQRTRLVQLLQTMADSTRVGEARNAYDRALRMLKQENLEWQWEFA